MTRKTAIRLLAGLAGVFGSLLKGQGTFRVGRAPLAEIKFGRPTAKAKAEYQKCLEDVEVANRRKPGLVHLGCFAPSEFEPGTAIITLNLAELEVIEVTLDGQTRRITRQELWEAL